MIFTNPRNRVSSTCHKYVDGRMQVQAITSAEMSVVVADNLDECAD